MTDIAFTTSLIAFGLIVVGCLIGVVGGVVSCLIGEARDFLRSRRELREHRERWMRLFLK